MFYFIIYFYIYNMKLLSLTTVSQKIFLLLPFTSSQRPPCPLSDICRYYLAPGVCRHVAASRSSGSGSILYFQEIGKNRHLWASLTDENDSLLSWLRRSSIHFSCKCLFFPQLMVKVANVTNLPPDDSASVLVAIWWNFCYDIPLTEYFWITQFQYQWRNFELNIQIFFYIRKILKKWKN